MSEKTQEDFADMVSKAMRRAFNLGQTYWQQADSESYAQNKKSDETAAKFKQLTDETRAAVLACQQAAPAVPDEREAFDRWHLRFDKSFKRYSVFNSLEIAAAWKAWQARAQLASQPAASVQEPVAAQPQDHQCRYPLCQSEAEQDRISAEVHAEMYSGEVQDKPEEAGKVEQLEQEIAALSAQNERFAEEIERLMVAPAVPDINGMVNRFLGWKLPKDFYPDCGITFKHNETWGAYPNNWPVGTNLFTADQAKAMFEYCLAAAPSSPAVPEGFMNFALEAIGSVALHDDTSAKELAAKLRALLAAAAPSAPAENQK